MMPPGCGTWSKSGQFTLAAESSSDNVSHLGCKQLGMSTNLQEVVETAVPTAISEREISDLRAGLNSELEETLAGWDRPGDPLKITKDRLRRGQACNAQLLGGGPVPMNEHIALGRVVDAAAPTIATAPDTPHRYSKSGQPLQGAWGHAIAEPLRVEDPELGDWYHALSTLHKKDHDQLVETRCEGLKGSIGDLRSFTVVSQNLTFVDLAADVVLSARPDLIVLGTERIVVEVKSGKGHGIGDELAFYALVESLSAGVAPALVVGISLLPLPNTFSLPVNIELLDRAASLVVNTARRCRAVDESVAAARWPLTTTGLHCTFCDLAEQCPDISDEHLEEALLMAGHQVDEDADSAEEEPW